MRALITGINGFVGTHLSAVLQRENFELIGIDHTIRPNSSKKQFAVDINDRDSVERVIGDIRPDHIYHLAAPAFIPDSYENPVKTFEDIIYGTINLLEIVRKKSPYSKLLYVGSSDEYGLYKGNAFHEDMLPVPCTPYASAKAAASLVCGQYARFYDINVICTRSFNHMGPGQSPRFVSASMAKQVATLEKNGETTLKLGNLGTSRDFLDVRDVVNAYYLIMKKEKNAGELYNICSGKPVLIQTILDNFLRLTDLPSRPGFSIQSEDQRRRFDNEILVGDNSKLKSHTDWKEQYTFEQTIQDTLNYWRKQV